MGLEKIVEFVSISKATPDELEHSGIPDSVPYSVHLFGYIEGQETFVSIQSGHRTGLKSQYESSIRVHPDTSVDWTERIPKLASEIARITGGSILPEDNYASELGFSTKLTQAQVAAWIRELTAYFDDHRLNICPLRYYDIPDSAIQGTKFHDKMRN